MTAPVLTVGELRARVESGTAWLDLRHPDWWRTDRPDHGGPWADGGPIDPDGLLMSHPCYCLLGQLLGDYYRAEITLDDAIRFGFDTAATPLSADASEEQSAAWEAELADEFDALAALWRGVIERRRLEAATGGRP